MAAHDSKSSTAGPIPERGSGGSGGVVVGGGGGTYAPGTRVRVTQQNPRLTGALVTSIEGTVVRFTQQKTGSWYAHATDDRLWLDRLELRKDDGERVVLNLDRYSNVEVVGG